MDLSNLSYAKGDSPRSPKTPLRNLPKTDRPTEHKSTPIDTDASSGRLAYEKQDGQLSSSLMFVLSGGEQREKLFLHELIKRKNIRSLRALFLSKKGQGLHPCQMQDRWSEIQKSGIITIDGFSYNICTIDKVFLLTDVDEFYEQLVLILQNTTSQNNAQWIISNPCFEIWLYYCYLNNPTKDLALIESLNVSKRSRKLKALGNKVCKGGLNPCLAFEKMKSGIEHSKIHFATDKNGIPVLFATNMHEMAQYIINVMDRTMQEYKSFIEQKDKHREQFRLKHDNE